MARSHIIYTVITYFNEDWTVVSAFTVKHELITWLKKYHKEYQSRLEVWKTQDGLIVTLKPETIDWKELIND